MHKPAEKSETPKHYHEVLSQLVTESTGRTPNFDFGFYTSYHELPAKANQVFSKGKAYDYLIVFVRPFPMIPLTKPLVKYKRGDLKTRMALHPKFSKNKFYNYLVDERDVPRVANDKRRRLRNFGRWMNTAAGSILNLPAWSITEVTKILTTVEGLTQQNSTKLILICPPAYPNNKTIDKLCRDITQQLTQSFVFNGTKCIDIHRLGENSTGFFENDNIHVSEAGHLYIAHSIHKSIFV